jgi:hypothetical protein
MEGMRKIVKSLSPIEIQSKYLLYVSQAYYHWFIPLSDCKYYLIGFKKAVVTQKFLQGIMEAYEKSQVTLKSMDGAQKQWWEYIMSTD